MKFGLVRMSVYQFSPEIVYQFSFFCFSWMNLSVFCFVQLIGGSAGTEQQDERENAPVDGSDDTAGKSGGDGYTEAIPGPVTRLFVLANRGLANLIQDLILVSDVYFIQFLCFFFSLS